MAPRSPWSPSLFVPDLEDDGLCQEILDIQQEGYGRELALAGVEAPPLVDGPEDLRASGERFLACAAPPGSEVALAGALSWVSVGDEVEPLRLMVRRAFARRGVARALFSRMIATAAEEGASRIHLEVAAVNLPARRLYESLGFTPTGQRLVGPGVTLIAMERVPSRRPSPPVRRAPPDKEQP